MKKTLHRHPFNRTKKPPVIHGEYSRDGYEVWIGSRLVYTAGNHVRDSTQLAMCEEDRLPLRTIRKFCIKTTREMAAERREVFAGVERVAEEAPDSGQEPS
jgi:hypothetical protein